MSSTLAASPVGRRKAGSTFSIGPGPRAPAQGLPGKVFGCFGCFADPFADSMIWLPNLLPMAIPSVFAKSCRGQIGWGSSASSASVAVFVAGVRQGRGECKKLIGAFGGAPGRTKERQAEPRINTAPASNSRSSARDRHPGERALGGLLAACQWWRPRRREARTPERPPRISRDPGRDPGPHPMPAHLLAFMCCASRA